MSLLTFLITKFLTDCQALLKLPDEPMIPSDGSSSNTSFTQTKSFMSPCFKQLIYTGIISRYESWIFVNYLCKRCERWRREMQQPDRLKGFFIDRSAMIRRLYDAMFCYSRLWKRFILLKINRIFFQLCCSQFRH